MLENNQNFISYKSRWLMLALFCALNFCNAMLWVTFAPISDSAVDYFNGNSASSSSSVGNITAINMLAVIFQILYGPGTVLGTILMKKNGLRYTLLCGGLLIYYYLLIIFINNIFNKGLLSVIGSAIRVLGAYLEPNISSVVLYMIMFLGQSFAAVGQPLFLNLPAALASAWFPVEERDIATTIGSLFSPLGNAIGQLVSVSLISESNTGIVEGMSLIMAVELFACCIVFIISYFLFKSSPPTPPSHSTQLRTVLDKGNSAVLTSGEGSLSWRKTRIETMELFNNKDYVVLFVAFSVGLGIFNTILTLINQMVLPHGYSDDDAGTFGAVLILSGLIGAGFGGYLLEKTHAYRTILKVGFWLCFCAVIVLVLMLRPNNFGLLTFAFSLLGFLILPMLPTVLENCAECTYPIGEELSVGILFVGGNWLGIGFIFIMQYLLTENQLSNTSPWLTSANIFMTSLILTACITLLFYNGQYRRLENELTVPMISDHNKHNNLDEERLARVGSVDNSRSVWSNVTIGDVDSDQSVDTTGNMLIGVVSDQEYGRKK